MDYDGKVEMICCWIECELWKKDWVTVVLHEHWKYGVVINWVGEAGGREWGHRGGSDGTHKFCFRHCKFKYGLHIQIVMTSMENMLSWELRKCFKLEGRRDLLCQCSWRSIKMKLGKDPETNHLEFTDNPPQSSFDGVVWVKAWREEAWERIRGEEIYIGYSQLSEKSFTVKKKKKKGE